MQYKLVALGGGGMVDDYRWYGAEEMAAVATCQNWMTDFGICFCDDGDSRGKSRGWGVEMRRWGGRTSDMVALLRVSEEHRSRDEADNMVCCFCLCFHAIAAKGGKSVPLSILV